MPVKLFTFAFQPDLHGFDPTALDRFCLDKKIHETQAHFFQQEGKAYWTICVSYQLVPESLPPAKAEQPSLSQRDQLLVQRLREYRREIAQSQGVPSYVVFTDRQMREMVQAQVRQMADFEPIHGFGPKRVARYGQGILEVMATFVGQKSADHAE